MDSQDAILKRAQELSTKEALSGEELTELESLVSQVETIQKEQARVLEVKNKQAQLANLTGEVQKGLNTVAFRPDFVTHVSSESTPQSLKSGYPVSVNIRRDEYKPREVSEMVYSGLKKDGYSESVIAAHATPAYSREFVQYMKSGGKMYGEMAYKAMTEAGDGGVLVPIQWAELITNPPMTTMLRSQVRNIPTNTLIQRYPRIKTTDVKYPAYPVTVTWGGEQPSLSDQGSNLKTEQVDIQVSEVYAKGDFSISLLEDNPYGLNTYIPEIFQESLDVDLDGKIIAGVGVGGANPQPWGMDEAVAGTPVVNTIDTTSAGALSYDDLVNLMTAVPQQYRASGIWLFNSATYALIAKIKDNNGRPLFNQGFGDITQMPGGGATWWTGSLLGRPYIISENMPSITNAGKKFIYYGDYSKAYYLLNRTGPTIRVLDQVAYTQGNYQYVLRARMGGRVIRPNALGGMKGKTA